MPITICGGSTDIYPLQREDLQRRALIWGRLLEMKIEGVSHGLCLKDKNGRVYTHPTLFSRLNPNNYDNTKAMIGTLSGDYATVYLFPGDPGSGVLNVSENALASAAFVPLKRIPVDLLMVLMTELLRQDRFCSFYANAACERGRYYLSPRNAILIANDTYRETVICPRCLQKSLDAGQLKPEDVILDGRTIPINGPLMIWTEPALYPTR